MSDVRREKYRRAQRLLLPDDTVWPAVDATEEDQAAAYRLLLTHPWGANVSCQKVRQLRREQRRG